MQCVGVTGQLHFKIKYGILQHTVGGQSWHWVNPWNPLNWTLTVCVDCPMFILFTKQQFCSRSLCWCKCHNSFHKNVMEKLENDHQCGNSIWTNAQRISSCQGRNCLLSAQKCTRWQLKVLSCLTLAPKDINSVTIPQIVEPTISLGRCGYSTLLWQTIDSIWPWAPFRKLEKAKQ